MKAAVIGSGIAGLAAALRLKNKGYDVTVFEAADVPGGKIKELKSKGFRFDMGPSLFTLPHLVDELFLLFPEYKSTFEYKRLKTICNYFWEDGKTVQAKSDINKFANEIQQTFGTEKSQIIDYLEESKKIYELIAPTFLEKTLHKSSTWLSRDTVKPLLSITKLHLTQTLAETNKNRFKNKYVQQLFNRYATYNGSSPFLTPGIMQIIPHLEFNLGAFFPKNGMRDIVNSLVELAEYAGIKFVFNEKVKKIIVCKNEVKGVELEKQIFKCDLVISNSDIYYTQNKLLKKKYTNPKYNDLERSSSAFIFYWGIKETHPELDVHNILFSSNYQSEFNALFKEHKISSDPTIYIHISSKINKEDAPKNCENWFVMINTPCNGAINWMEQKDRIRHVVIKKIENILGKNISNKIETEDILTPLDIKKKTGSYKGALYGTSSNSKFAAFLRHPNFSSKVKNLYHCGGSVHPGGGIPLCLQSAKIVSSLIPEANE